MGSKVVLFFCSRFMNVVIDTNLIIAAYYNKRSHSARILELARRGQINVLWSAPVFAEAKHILDNIKADNNFRLSLLSIYKESRKVTKPQKVLGAIANDPSDNKLVGCALAGASYIITSDRHLLDVGEFGGVKMVRPADFLEKLKKKR
jgi:uncharacterized protein